MLFIHLRKPGIGVTLLLTVIQSSILKMRRILLLGLLKIGVKMKIVMVILLWFRRRFSWKLLLTGRSSLGVALLRRWRLLLRIRMIHSVVAPMSFRVLMSGSMILKPPKR